MTLTIAAVVCTRNRAPDLERSLTSLAWQTRPCDRVLVVDDSDADRRSATLDACERSGARPEVIVKDTPGLTASRNVAIECTTTDLILFIDDDVVLRPDYVEQVVDAFRRDDALAGAGGSIDDDHVYGWRWLRRLLMIPGRTTGRVYPSGWSSQTPRGRDLDVEHLIGCNMAFRRRVLDDHRFDTRFEGYALGEDLELTHRLHLDGHRLRVIGDARLWHLTDLPAHDRRWGYREVVIRPIVAKQRFRRWAFLVSASTFALANVARNRERARGNLDAIKDVLGGRVDDSRHTSQKERRWR